MVQDWSEIRKTGDTRDGRFYSFAFADWMPKLNTNNEEVIQVLLPGVRGLDPEIRHRRDPV